ncbi:DinB family protein [Caballeronia sordidicola]|uniref:DinB family protein n=1 Tax=Caballeronia sordidicola TaxID=196367 RepID=A0A158I557_CABSO|nr:DinB family protein [Caballeronia sordidicola]SAL51389.1 DinB family protein [Caballeronia sordidicola]
MSNPLSRHFLSMAYNNAWANHRLLKACSQLSQEAFVAPRTGFFPSIKATLNHNLTVDWLYIDALERELHGKPPNGDIATFFEPEEHYAACADLQREQRLADHRLIEYAKHLTDTTLERPVTIIRPRATQRETRTRLLGHLFQHQIHHRGQAHAMLSATAVAPPQLDEFFCEMDTALRATDLAEMGLSERQVWG